MKTILRFELLRVLLIAGIFVGFLGRSTQADDATKGADTAAGEQSEDDQSVSADPDAEFELSDEVRDVLSPLFAAIQDAEVSRATVEVLSDSLIAGRVVESKQAAYQIASRKPDKFTIYLKDPKQRTRIFNDGDTMTVAMAADAFFRLPNQLSNRQAVIDLPIPLGPYPEPVLALTLAGVDPALSLVSGMKSIQLIDKKDFQGKVPAYHLRGVQADAVTWDLWLSRGDNPQPLRMLVDLTPMLLSSKELQLPGGYSHQIRYDFASWRVTGEVSDDLFTFKPSKNATEYQSLNHYNQAMAAKADQHPLLAESVPDFKLTLLDGRELDTSDLKDRVVVLDFWTTWHEPCAEILLTLKKATDKFSKQGVSLIAINIREDKKAINQFLATHNLELRVGLDPDGQIASRLRIEAIPQTILLGRDGKIESVHQGYPGQQPLYDRLTEELEVLSVGGRIATARPNKATGMRESKTTDTKAKGQSGSDAPTKEPVPK